MNLTYSVDPVTFFELTCDVVVQISDSKKPPEVVEKIVTGKLRKFYSDVCLTEQEHMVEEGNPKVSKALKDKGLAVQSFELFSI